MRGTNRSNKHSKYYVQESKCIFKDWFRTGNPSCIGYVHSCCGLGDSDHIHDWGRDLTQEHEGHGTDDDNVEENDDCSVIMMGKNHHDDGEM